MRTRQLAAVLVFAASAAQVSASVDPAVVLVAELRASRPHEADLVTTVTAPNHHLDVTLQIETAGPLLEARRRSMRLSLAPGVSQQVNVPVTADSFAPAAPFGRIDLRVVGSDGEPLAFESHGVGRVSGRELSLLPAGEFEARVERRAAASTAAEAHSRARQLAAEVRAAGKRPVAAPRVPAGAAPVASAPESESQRAWDAEAGAGEADPENLLIPPDDDPCWPWLAVGNSSYQVRGQLGYRDDFYGATRYAVDGYPVVIETQVRIENQCGGVSFRTQQYTANTTSNGWFSVNVSSHIAPGGPEPVVAFRATATEVGLANCGFTSCFVQPQRQSLGGTQFAGAWEGSSRRIHPVFTASNAPYPFFFRWNDEIKSLKARWAAATFGSGYTPFTAAYIASASPPVYFWPSEEMVVFDTANRWIVKWVMAHEFGHQFQYTLQGNQLGGGGPHAICDAVSDAVGFVEGFADWHASWWEVEGRNLYFSCSGAECWSNCTPGYRREGNVMAFFWDLFDGTNHGTHDSGLDPVVFPLSLLKNWSSYSSFPSFYNDFVQRSLWGSQATAVNTLRTVNKVTVAQ